MALIDVFRKNDRPALWFQCTRCMDVIEVLEPKALLEPPDPPKAESYRGDETEALYLRADPVDVLDEPGATDHAEHLVHLERAMLLLADAHETTRSEVEKRLRDESYWEERRSWDTDAFEEFPRA